MNSVNIEGVELRIVEFQGQRVLTFGMIDQVHQRPEGTARRTFGAIRERLKCGVHYFKIGADVIRTHFPGLISDKYFGEIALLTERGYLMLVKLFSDELAWKIQDMLVEAYFCIKALAVNQVPAGLPDPNDNISLMEGWLEQAKQNRAAQLALQAAEAERSALKAEVQALTPKAEYHDKVADAENCHSVEQAAKILGTGRNRLFEKLRDLDVLMDNNLPRQEQLDLGRFKVVQQVFRKKGHQHSTMSCKTLVTGKGMTYLAKLLAETSMAKALEAASSPSPPSATTKAIPENSGLH